MRIVTTMSKSTAPTDHVGQTNNTTETADLAFLLRTMHANLSLFDRLQPDQLIAAVKDANRQIARLQALQLHCMAGMRRRRSDPHELACELAIALHITDCQWSVCSPRRRPDVVPTGGQVDLPNGGQVIPRLVEFVVSAVVSPPGRRWLGRAGSCHLV